MINETKTTAEATISSLRMNWSFQVVEFEVLDGYFFNEGLNTKIKEQIKVYFDKRLEAKAAGNDGLQQAYKLLMNSSYGKLIEKTPNMRHPLQTQRWGAKVCREAVQPY